jgi:hypothetical protein
MHALCSRMERELAEHAAARVPAMWLGWMAHPAHCQERTPADGSS